MQTEMLNLVGGSGEKPWSPKDVREAPFEDIEYTAEELTAAWDAFHERVIFWRRT